jgi:hypothetical protein
MILLLLSYQNFQVSAFLIIRLLLLLYIFFMIIMLFIIISNILYDVTCSHVQTTSCFTNNNSNLRLFDI